MTRFDVVCVILIFCAIFGWPPPLLPNKLPAPVYTLLIIVVLLVLIILGNVR